MAFNLDIDDIVWARNNTLCTFTRRQPTPWYLFIHSTFLEYHSIFDTMLCTCTRTSVDNFFTTLAKVKDDITYVPSFLVLLFRCIRSISCSLTNICTKTISFLSTLTAHASIWVKFLYSISFTEVTPYWIVLLTSSFSLMSELTLFVHNTTRCLLLIHLEICLTRI